MMLSKIDSGTNDGAGNSNSSQLLRELEAISKALYLHKTPRNGLLSFSTTQSQSVGKSHISEPETDIPKSSSVWSWKKPLKSLIHFRHQKFSCLFSLHVRSIEGLPAYFNELHLSVHWKRKDEILRTHPAKVSECASEIDDTLTHRCPVYGVRNGPNNSAKYDPKLFSIYVSVIEAPQLDFGKILVDITRILPLTLEELEGEKSSGKWMTSFKLSGKAKGANLNVSFGFLVMRDDLVKSQSHMSVPKTLNLVQNMSTTAENAPGISSTTSDVMLQSVGSVSGRLNYGSLISSQSADDNIYHELLSPRLELLKSMDFLYQKLDEGALSCSTETKYDLVEPLEQKSNVETDTGKETELEEYESTEFDVIECGVEINQEMFKLDEGDDKPINTSTIETIDFHEIIKDNVIALDKKMNHNSSDKIPNDHAAEFAKNDWKYDENSISIKGTNTEELGIHSNFLWIKEEPRLTLGKLLEQENHTSTKADYKTSQMVNRSLSLDDASESVASDFLNMLGLRHGSFQYSESDAESPTDSLFKQFENEVLYSGNSSLYYDTQEDCPDFVYSDPPESDLEDYDEEDFDLSSLIDAVEEEHKRVSQLRTRRKAKMLEDLETEALMQEWGLNDYDFHNSPHNFPSGFGSPIELLPEDAPKLPPLAEAIGPLAQMKGGGFLRYMDPSLFYNSRNGGTLIVQVSRPVVFPAEMGHDIMDILRNIASLGIENLSMQASSLMPLEDLTGKTIQQAALKAPLSKVISERQSLLQNEFSFKMGQDYVSLDNISSLAMDKIENLLIDGLRIQCGMYNEEAPSCISTHSIHNKNSTFSFQGVEEFQLGDVKELMNLSITLDDWLRLDAGIIDDESQNQEGTMKILKAHHAKSANVIWDKTLIKEQGLLGNNLTVAQTVQLRDPLRNNEPVGAPMLCLIQVERVLVESTRSLHCLTEERCSQEEDNNGDHHLFKISSVHLLGVNSEPDKKQPIWGTTRQVQSGSRWLLASGMGETLKVPPSKSKAIVIKSPSTMKKLQDEDLLWSISSHVNGEGTVPKQFISRTLHNRNPDFILLNEEGLSLDY